MALLYTPLTALTVVNLNGLANGAYWVSPDVDNNTILGIEIEALLTLVTTVLAGVNGAVQIYIAGSIDGGSNYAGGITSESDAVYVPLGDDVSHWSPNNVISYTSETLARTPKKRIVVNSPVPRNFKFIVFNNTGTPLDAAGNSIALNSIKY